MVFIGDRLGVSNEEPRSWKQVSRDKESSRRDGRGIIDIENSDRRAADGGATDNQPQTKGGCTPGGVDSIRKNVGRGPKQVA